MYEGLDEPSAEIEPRRIMTTNLGSQIENTKYKEPLKLNPSKTELVWLGSSRRWALPGWWTQHRWGTHQAGYARPWPRRHDWHVTRTCFYHLRQLRVVRRSLTTDTAHSLVRALVHSQLDYCNGVLAGMFQYQIDRLQSVLRAAARLVLGLPKWASVSDAMHDELHWLPFPERVEFKLCSVVYKCLE